MNRYLRLAVLGLLGLGLGRQCASGQVELWLSDPNTEVRFEKQAPALRWEEKVAELPGIEVEDSQTFQSMEGFGWCLTGGSAIHIIRMEAASRAALLRELFGPEGLGSSYLRVSIGASDLNERVFSYDDLPEGEVDPELARFSLGPDRADVIPVLKEILTMNPRLKILGSPWSPPAWMKTNHDTRGGSLKPEFYATYAQYFVKYIQGMQAEGIPIDAITVQNEPLHPGNNPSLLMPAAEQAEFIKHYLGPAFAAAGIKTRIIIYDHNADRPDYPISILDDPEAKKYVDGSAFHFYAGKIEALNQVHAAHPDKHIYFTEQWVGAPGIFRRDVGGHVKNLIIGASRNWSRTVLEWNLAADARQDPHTDRGGCDRCLGAVTIEGNKVTRNPAYYIVAHASKFVRPGSVRIGSNLVEGLPNVAFRTTGGKHVVIVLNSGQQEQKFQLRYAGKATTATLGSGAVGTYVW